MKIAHEKWGRRERTVLLGVRKLFSYMNLQTAWSNHQYATDNRRPFTNTFFSKGGGGNPWIEKYLLHIFKDACPLSWSFQSVPVFLLIEEMKAPVTWCSKSLGSQISLRRKSLERKKNPVCSSGFQNLRWHRWRYFNKEVAGPVQNITYCKHILIEFC